MLTHGGSFVRHLGRLMQHADPENLGKIREKWPAYLEKYGKIGDAMEKEDRLKNQR